MKLTLSQDHNPNYVAKIVEITNFTKHPNADKLKLANVNGYMIATGIDTEPGLYIYFPTECQISKWYLKENNLYRDSKLNKNPDEKPGFFEDKGRVKAISLRSFISEGFIMPILSLNLENPTVGAEFDTVDNQLLVKKYVVKVSNQGTGGKNVRATDKYEDTIVEGQFRYHLDTSKFQDNLFRFKPGTYIHISDKWHGTSFGSCNLLVKKKLSFKDKIAKFFGIAIVESEYKKFCHSRKVVKDPELNKSLTAGFYDYDIWNLAHEVVKDHLSEGMSIYAEIVGYLPTGSMIQSDYDYGCIYDQKLDYQKMTPQQMYKNRLFDIRVYRITYTSSEGKVFEFSPLQLREFCGAHGLNPIIHRFYGTVNQWLEHTGNPYIDGLNDDIPENHFLESLKREYLEMNCPFCKNRVPAEGVVLRIDGITFEAYKLKSKRFLTRESCELDKGKIDIESS